MVCLNLFNRNCSAQHRLRFVLNPMPEATLSGETASKHALQLLQPNLCALRQYAVQICYAMLCYVMLCCVAPSWAVLCCAALSCAVLCHAVLHYAVLCCAVLCCAVLCCAVLCCAVLCCASLFKLCPLTKVDLLGLLLGGVSTLWTSSNQESRPAAKLTPSTKVPSASCHFERSVLCLVQAATDV